MRKLPGWHRRETEFRDWYAGLLDRVNLSHDAGYALALRVLGCPEQVTGYREVRYPKQDQVRQQIESELGRTVVETASATEAVLAEAVGEPSGI